MHIECKCDPRLWINLVELLNFFIVKAQITVHFFQVTNAQIIRQSFQVTNVHKASTKEVHVGVILTFITRELFFNLHIAMIVYVYPVAPKSVSRILVITPRQAPASNRIR